MIKNRIVILGSFIMLSVCVYLTPNFITLLLFYSITTLIIFSVLHLLLAKRNIVISQNIYPSHISHGKDTEYRFTIFNNSFFPYPKVVVRFKYTNNLFLNQLNNLDLALYSNESLVIKKSITGNYRGTYSLGAEQLVVYDILNIFTYKLKIKENKELTVLPKVTQISELLLNANYLFSEYDYESNNLLEDSTKGIRDYQHGDSLKNIHWKLYAKFDKLMVRDKENSAVNKTMIFLDTKTLNSSFEDNIIYQDKLIEAYLSIVLKIIESNHIFDVGYQSEQCQFFNYNKNYTFDFFFNETVNINFSDKSDISKLLTDFLDIHYHNKNLFGIDIVIFTLNPNETKFEKIIHSLAANFVNVHVVCTNPNLVQSNFISDEAIRYYYLESTTDISELVLRNVAGGYYEDI